MKIGKSAQRERFKHLKKRPQPVNCVIKVSRNRKLLCKFFEFLSHVDCKNRRKTEKKFIYVATICVHWRFCFWFDQICTLHRLHVIIVVKKKKKFRGRNLEIHVFLDISRSGCKFLSSKPWRISFSEYKNRNIL